MNGLWIGEFASSLGLFGAGVLVLKNGRIYGGDSGYIYLGKYFADGAKFSAELKIEPFIKGYVSVFGTSGDSFTLTLTGTLSAGLGMGVAQGEAVGSPGVLFTLKLSRKCLLAD